MESRPLGHEALRVSALGLGCMSMSGTYGKSDDAASIAVIHRALDLGVTFLDSSDMYGWGHNEELLARALAGRRQGVAVATKFGQVRSPDGGGNLVDGSAAYVRTACEASLKRLGTDTIDLYYQHRVDPKVSIEETVGAMARLREEGKIRALGLCEVAPATLRRAQAVHPIAAVQMEYSLLYRQPAEEILAVCRELGVAFVAYAPIGRSLLAGGVERPEDIPADDRRRQHPRFQGGNLDHNARLVRRLAEIARGKGATPAQLALAWLLARGRDIVPIPGTKRVDRLEENVGALRVRLGADDLRQIDEAMPPGAGAGTRYPEPQMKGVYI
ncbi:MAG TPA: aldo/keto reductase [Methylomirabilota bacterium]|nr:aldo/keto reductase [Methylomirabilota bacterium]